MNSKLSLCIYILCAIFCINMVTAIPATVEDICNLPEEPGFCKASIPLFFYDRSSRTCREFIYGGCNGNANQFSTISECESVCIHHKEPTSNENDISVSDLGEPHVSFDLRM